MMVLEDNELLVAGPLRENLELAIKLSSGARCATSTLAAEIEIATRNPVRPT